MEITIHRKKGLLDSAYGTRLSLIILFDSKIVGRLETRETLRLSIPDVAGALQVGLPDFVPLPYPGSRPDKLLTISNALDISPSSTAQAFSVRTRGWVFFDFLGLAYVAPLSRWVLALEVV